MNAFDFIAGAAYLTVLGFALRWLLRHLPGGRAERPPLPRRTPADVVRDAAAHRAAIDLDTCRAIWPDARSWKTAEAQHRIDTAKQRKENDK